MARLFRDSGVSVPVRPFYLYWAGLLLWALLGLLWALSAASSAHAYSLLTHEQIIDLTWSTSIAPLLRSRYPNLTAAQLEQARAYAYGGCAIQDIGYYPFGDKFFSELTHYVRTGDFVAALFRDSRNANELAFAVGALSHYIGDSVGHSLATNVSVPVEFPRLRAEYGPVVTYAENTHAHVQTEFAFDIDEIAHRRLAPLQYLRHVGLKVPTTLLAKAFDETYGLGENFRASKSRRINVRGYRFSVHTLIPRVAYALTVLHRHDFPPDSQSPEFQKLASEAAQAAAEADWEKYRRKPGIITYSLAGLVFILPKVGALKLLAIRGPTDATEQDYVRSVNRSSDAMRSALAKFGGPKPGLENRDLDTGAAVAPGSYKLTDETYAELLHRLVAVPQRALPAEVKANILAFYADPNAPIYTKTMPARWREVEDDLTRLEAMPVTEPAPGSGSSR